MPWTNQCCVTRQLYGVQNLTGVIARTERLSLAWVAGQH
jgi:hypothetical protein